MQKQKLTAVGSVIAQIRDGQEFEAIVDNGIVYVPLFGGLSLAAGASTVETTDDEPKEEKAAAVKADKPKASRGKKKEEAAEEPEKTDDGGAEEKSGGDISEKAVLSILDELDLGKLNSAKAVDKLVTATGLDKAHIVKCIETFEKDSTTTVDSIAAMIIEGGSAKEEKKAPRKSAAKKEEAAVSIEDLEVGDAVKVWWGKDGDEEYNEFFTGEVVRKARGKVYVKYEDGAEEALNEDFNSEIFKL